MTIVCGFLWKLIESLEHIIRFPRERIRQRTIPITKITQKPKKVKIFLVESNFSPENLLNWGQEKERDLEIRRFKRCFGSITNMTLKNHCTLFIRICSLTKQAYSFPFVEMFILFIPYPYSQTLHTWFWDHLIHLSLYKL